MAQPLETIISILTAWISLKTSFYYSKEQFINSEFIFIGRVQVNLELLNILVVYDVSLLVSGPKKPCVQPAIPHVRDVWENEQTDNAVPSQSVPVIVLHLATLHTILVCYPYQIWWAYFIWLRKAIKSERTHTEKRQL